MNAKQDRKNVGMVGIWGLVITMGISVPFVMAGSSRSEGSRDEQQNHVTQDGTKGSLPSTQPFDPPLNDSEMVIQPNFPPDPDAVVIPPIVDPEMAVDPATGQPMTEEKLERITPDGLEKKAPKEESRELQKK